MFPKMKLWGSATVGSKGQVVIPAEAREALNIQEGDKLIVMATPPGNGIVFLKGDAIEDMLQHIQTDLTELKSKTETKADGAV
jgi:AbrB family looped-hinge helix DNA binding protein